MAITTPPPVVSEPAPEPEPVDRPRSTAGRAIGVVLGALLIASLLNAEALAKAADQQPFGWRRDVAKALARPIHGLADVTGLTAPRRWLDDLVGNDDGRTSGSFGGGLTPERRLDLERAASPSTTTAPATTTTTAVERRTPTTGRPLRVLFAGDSLIGNLADGFARFTDDSGRVRVTSEVHIGTGLARPDVLDWASFLAQRLRSQKPEVVYLMFGGNDDQPLRGGPGDPPALFTRDWKREYRRRVALMMDIARGKNRTVVWIGVPAVARDRLDRARRIMNEVAREEARERPHVDYVSTDAIIAPGGRFTPRVEIRGHTIDARAPDGVHVTIAGADVVAPVLFARIAEEWHLDER